jgi:hypothetical protein
VSDSRGMPTQSISIVHICRHIYFMFISSLKIIRKLKKKDENFRRFLYHVKCSKKFIKIVYKFRKFNVNICGKKLLEKISILRENIKKRVE